MLVIEPFLYGAEFMSECDRQLKEASTGQCRRGFFVYRSAARRTFGNSCSAILFSLLITGCGGSEPQPSPQPTDAVRQPVSSGPVGFAKRVEEEVDDGVDLTGVDPKDVFDPAPAPPPNFVTTGKATLSRPVDRFVATIDPAAGSASFTVSEPSVPGSNVVASGRVGQLPVGFTAIADAPIVDGWPSRIVCNADHSEMVFIPGGSSIIGTGDGPADCVP
jgi:hypothetical protein